MSIPVDLAELAEATRNHDYAYLVTVTTEANAHVVAVVPTVGEGVLDIGDLGRRSMANATTRPEVTLVWPPREVGGHSLIVDGQARATAPDGITVTPLRAVLHRPVPRSESVPAPDGACGNDCIELPLAAGAAGGTA